MPRDADSAPALITPIVLVLQFISGVFFVYTELPTWMQNIAAIFPLKWLTQGMRSVFLPDTFEAAEASGSWQLSWVAVVLVIWTVDRGRALPAHVPLAAPRRGLARCFVQRVVRNA